MRRFLTGLLCGVLLMTLPIGWAVHRIYFPDVPSDEWYTEAVNELAARGIFSGYPDGTFRPGNFVNRAELAVVLQELLHQVEGKSSTTSSAPLPPPQSVYLPLSSPSPSPSPQPPPPSPAPQPSPQPSPPPLPPSSVTVNTTYNIPLSRSLAFFTNRLSISSGAIRSTLGATQGASSTIGVNDEVLSESFGLAFNGLAFASEKDLFAREFQFFKQYILAPNKLAIWKLNPDLTPYNLANATIDDLKIIKGLLRGFERFGIVEYRDTALAMAGALKQYGLRNNTLVSHVSWNSNGVYSADHLILGYADFETMKMLAAYDTAWNTILTNTVAVVKNGQYSNGLFPDRYRFATSQYERDDALHSIFQVYIIEHLAYTGETAAAQKLLNFFKDEWEDRGKIFGRYTSGGHAAVSYEDLSVYAILSRAAVALNDTTFASQLIGKVLSLQITNPISLNFGAFLWSENELIYAFSQLNALYTVALFSGTTIQPTSVTAISSGSNSPPPSPPPGVTVPPATPGSTPVITAQNYVLWHMSDIYYGSHHIPDFTTMVNDMDTLTWNDALIAGDMSGDGSVANFNGMKGVITSESSHPWSNFNFLAGNHEYQCGSPPSQGCLDNYKSIINPNFRYTFDRGNIHFIVMSIDGEKYRMSNETMAWLRSEVAANQGKIIVLATHQMPHALGNTTPSVQSILDELGIDLWLFGHAHCKHGDASCTRHGAYGDYYTQAETTFVDAGYIGNMESRYIIFTEGSNQVRVLSRYHKNGGRFQTEFEHTATLRHAFQR